MRNIINHGIACIRLQVVATSGGSPKQTRKRVRVKKKDLYRPYLLMYEVAKMNSLLDYCEWIIATGILWD